MYVLVRYPKLLPYKNLKQPHHYFRRTCHPSLGASMMASWSIIILTRRMLRTSAHVLMAFARGIMGLLAVIALAPGEEVVKFRKTQASDTLRSIARLASLNVSNKQ
jgi:hypothetical protein